MLNFCNLNFLSLNTSKSVILQFRNPNAAPSNVSPYVPVDGKSVACLSATKLLGLYVSDNFSWQVHADYIVGKLSSAVFLMSNLLKTVHEKQLLMVYYAY
jgi:hypothetical protein